MYTVQVALCSYFFGLLLWVTERTMCSIVQPFQLHAAWQYVRPRSPRPSDTGAGGDNGIEHNKNWLRFPYDSTILRSHYLHPHPYLYLYLYLHLLQPRRQCRCAALSLP